MRDLPPDAQALIGQARAEQPRTSPALRARVRAAVDRTIALSALPAVEPAHPELAGSKLTLAKLAAGLACIVGAVGFTLMIRPTASHAPLRSVHASTAVVRPASPARAPEQRVADLLPEPVAILSVAEPVQTVAVPRDSLAAELDLIRRADGELRADRPQSALRILRVHRAHHRNGQLASEREGLKLVAECTLGIPSAPQRAQSYLGSGSPSLVGNRIALACTPKGAP